MNILITVLVVAASTHFAFSEESKIQSTVKVGDYVQLPDAAGFVQYRGEHSGVPIYALSLDIGSAVPSGDFRLYARRDNDFKLIFSLPMLSHKGYRCINMGDTLSVHVITGYEEKPSPSAAPVVVINLSQLVAAYRNQVGTGQPATKPADKAPVKSQPSTASPKVIPQ